MTSDNGQLTDVHLALRGLLKNHCQGERRARKQTDLIRDLRAQGHGRAFVRRRVDDAETVAVPLDARAIFYLVRDLRLAGYPVMGSSGGMFWARTFDEFVRGKANYTSRFREMGHVARAFDRIERLWRSRRTQAVPAAPPALRQGTLLDEGTDRDDRGRSGRLGDESPGPPASEGGGPTTNEARGGPAQSPGTVAGRAAIPLSVARPAQGRLFDTAPGART